MDRNQAKMLVKRLIEDDEKKLYEECGIHFLYDEENIVNLLYDNGFVIESRLINEDDKENEENSISY